jgi:hypothetical protein
MLIRISIYIISILIVPLSWSFTFKAKGQPSSPSSENQMVELEIDPLGDRPVTRNLSLPAYRDRRLAQSLMVSIGQQLYYPVTTDVGGSSYETSFAQDPIRAIELEIAKKWNFSLLSISLGAALSHGSLSLNSASATLQQARFGAQVFLDTLFKEPYFGPFVGMGSSYSTLTTNINGLTRENNISPLTSYTFGVLIQLNMLNPDAAVIAYHEHQLENTYLSVGLNTTALANQSDINFESQQQVFVGLSLEL